MFVMDSDKRLRYLSLNAALRFATMSSSSFSSKAIGGTTSSTLVSGSVLAADRSTFVSGSVLAEEEDEDADDGVGAL